MKGAWPLSVRVEPRQELVGGHPVGGAHVLCASATVSTAHGTRVQVLVADLAKESDLADVEAVLRRDESIRVLVNNAGVARFSPFAASKGPDANSQIALNITALTRLTHAVLPGFVARNAGAVINIASVLAVHALPISSVYSATKAYVLQFSRGLQGELANTDGRFCGYRSLKSSDG